MSQANVIANSTAIKTAEGARFTGSNCGAQFSLGSAACPIIGTFRSDYDYEYEYKFFNVYPVQLPDCVRLSRQLVLSSKSRRCLDANY